MTPLFDGVFAAGGGGLTVDISGPASASGGYTVTWGDYVVDSISGGTPPYTYAWTDNGSSPAVTFLSPTAISTDVRQYDTPNTDSFNIKLTVTDVNHKTGSDTATGTVTHA